MSFDNICYVTYYRVKRENKCSILEVEDSRKQGMEEQEREACRGRCGARGQSAPVKAIQRKKD
jgi:hypothetical protein